MELDPEVERPLAAAPSTVMLEVAVTPDSKPVAVSV